MHHSIIRAVAIHDYDPQQQEENLSNTEDYLPINCGDFLEISVQEENGWWFGERLSDGRSGWFPASYVELVGEIAVENDLEKLPSYSSDIPIPLEPSPSPPPIDSPPDIAIDNAVSVEKHDFSDIPIIFDLNRENLLPAVVDAPTMSSSWSSVRDANALSSVEEEQRVYIDFNNASQNVKISGIQDGISEISIGASTLSQKASVSSKHVITTSSAFMRQSSHSISSSSLSLSESRPMASSEGKFAYANNFWGDKGDKSGFDVLVDKHRSGKEVCKDVAALMLERARIEEQYANSLLQLANSSLGNLEQGTAKTAWNQVKFDLQTQALSRMEFAKGLVDQVHKPLINFKNQQKKIRKNYEVTIANDRKNMVSKYFLCQKAQKNYLTRTKEAELASIAAAAAYGKKEHAKLEEMAKKERKKATIASYDFKTAVEDYENTRVRWEDDMEAACIEFQQAEEARLDFVKTTLHTYLAVQLEVNDKCKESSEMVQNSIESISKDVDIEMFVKQYFTGQQKPPRFQFDESY